MANLLLSLGSNLGSSLDYLERARSQLATQLGPLRYASAVIHTAPWGKTDQADFHNQVIVVSVSGKQLRSASIRKDLHALLDAVQAIEHGLGRRRDVHWGPRTIDIDILALDDLRYEDERLSLPHPWWQARNFVTDLLPPPLHYGYFGVLDQRE